MKNQTASRSVRPSRGGFLWVRLIVLGLGGWALWIAVTYTPENPPPGLICGIKKHTGIECPSCGITRGLTSLAHGRFHDAFHYYSPVFLVFPGLCIALVGAVLPDKVWSRFMQKPWFSVSLALGGGIAVLWILVRWILQLITT